MKKLFILWVAVFFPLMANASPYALELSSLCTMTVPDNYGGVRTVTEPAGYVTNIVEWNGVDVFDPVDPCGNPLNKVEQVNGSPASGTGGVTLSPTAAEQAVLAQNAYNTLINNGLTITSTSTPAIDGTYPINSQAVQNFEAIQTGINTNHAFPLGATQPWMLLNGTNVSIPSTTEFIAIATAVEAFLDQAFVAEQTEAAGGTPNWPSTSVTIQ